MVEEQFLSKLTARLKERYLENATIERLFYPDHPLPIEQCYLDLALIEDKIIHDQKNNQGNTREEARDYFLHNYERIQHSQRKLTPEQLQVECHHNPKRIYIEGAAGAGKTTLSQFIAYQWSKDHPAWKDYDFLFRIRLRNLTLSNYSEQKIDVIEFLEKECFQFGFSDSLTENEKNNLLHYLKSKTKKVLFILDGYDELSLENSTIKTLWENLIDSSYDFIITSRPGMQKANLRTQLNVAVLGFSDEQVEKYIQYFFEPQHTPNAQSHDGHLCLQTFRQNPNLWSLAHTPIQLELLCSIWGEDLKQMPDITLTRIYTLMLEQLLKRHEQKRLKKEENNNVILKDIDVAPLLESTKVYFEFLENLAFLGMEKNEFIISSSIIDITYSSLKAKPKEKAAFLHVLKTLGFITRDSDGRQMEFIHLTFQEYFAARYIVRCFKLQQSPKSYSTLSEFILKKKYHQHYEIVWWFIAGLLKDDMESLKNYFDLLQSEPNDLAETYQFNLQLHCLAECELRIQQESKDRLLNKLATWIQRLISNKSDNPMIGIFSLPILIINQELIISALSDSFSNISRYGGRYFYRLSNLPEPILQQLVKHLSHENEDVQSDAAKTLSNQTILPDSILQTLEKLLSNKNEIIQLFAAQALSEHTLLPEAILQSLVTLLSHENKNVQTNAEEVLTYQTILPESILQQLVKHLSHENEDVQFNAAEVLNYQTILPDSILLQLIRLLGHENRNIRYNAEKALSNQTTLPDSVLQVLEKHLSYENEDVQFNAAIIALSNQTKLSEPILQQLVKHLSHENEDVQFKAAEALSHLTTLPETVLQSLVTLLGHDNKDVRANAAWALFYQTALPEMVLQSLTTLLNDDNEAIRANAVKALSHQTRLPEAVLQSLVKLLSHDNKDIRFKAAEALSHQTRLPEAVLQSLVTLLSHDNKDIRLKAAEALSHQTRLPETVLQSLVTLLSHNNKDIRFKAAWALFYKTTLPETVLQSLATLLNDDNEAIRANAVKALSHQTRLPEAVLQSLVTLLSHDNKDIWLKAAEALSHQTTLPETILQSLVKLLSNNNEAIWTNAARALSHQTTLPETILQSLATLLNDDNKYIRLKAAEALSYQTRLPETILQQLLLNTMDNYRLENILSRQMRLPKSVLINFGQRDMSSFDILRCIKNISITSLYTYLNRNQWEESDRSLLKLILLKCLEQKIALYFFKDTLYVDDEAQGEFSSECQTQIIQTLGQLFTEITGISASTLNNSELSFSLQITEKNENNLDFPVPKKEPIVQEQIQKYDIFINEIKETKEAIEALINHTDLKARVTQELQICSKKLETAKLNAMHTNSKVRLAGQTTFDECINNLNYLRTTLELGEDYPADQLNRVKSYLEMIVNQVSPKIELHSYSITQMQEVQSQGLFFTQRYLSNALNELSPLGKDFKDLLKTIKTTMGSHRYSCFISYAKPIDENNGSDRFVPLFLEALRDHLLLAGFNPLLDFKCIEAGENIETYMNQTLISNHWLLIGTPSLPQRLNQQAQIAFEMHIENLRKVNKLTNVYPMIPVLVVGNAAQSLPWHKQSYNTIDLAQSSYLAGLKKLLQALSQMPEQQYNDLWKVFEAKYPEHMQALSASLVTQILQSEQQKERQRKAQLKNKQAGIYQAFSQLQTNTEEEFTFYSRPVSNVHMWQPNNTNQLPNNSVAPNYSSSMEKFDYPK